MVALALLDEAGRVLMQRRRSSSEHGGLWEFPGGKIEPGEGPKGALLREISEELDIRLISQSVQPLTFVSGPRGDMPDGEGLAILLFTCRTWYGEPRCIDAEELAWTPLDALLELDMPPLDRPLAKALIAAMQNNLI